MGQQLIQKLRADRDLMILFFVIDVDGNLIELSFEFEEDSPLAEVRPEVYYRIEQEIKSKLKHTIHEEGKKYNI
ncbi:MAG: DUF5043 domain-containing protein, partial [Rikenellaceae bacterium]|nr:DUF5043 domain-containing protein [Rikenellaceae bacterium]